MQPLYSVNAPSSANDERLDGLVRLLGRYFGSAAVLVSSAGSARHIWASPGLSDVAKIICISETTPTTLVWPLQAQAGAQLGTLYLHFDRPRTLDARQQEALQDFAALALDLLARETDEALQRHEIAALRDSERRMALAIAGSGTGIWDRDISSGEIYYSSSWKALLGYADHEVGNRIEESYTRVHPADLDYVRATIQAHLDQRTDAYEVEHRLRCRDGQYKWVCSRGKVVERDKHGKPLRMIGTTTDITAMRRLSEQVQQTATLMTDLTNEIPGMVFQVRRQSDGKYAVTYASAGAQAICGLSAENTSRCGLHAENTSRNGLSATKLPDVVSMLTTLPVAA